MHCHRKPLSGRGAANRLRRCVVAFASCFLFACAAYAEPREAGRPAPEGAHELERNGHSNAASHASDVTFPIPEVVAIPGAERLGFTAVSKFEITWRQYGASLEGGRCKPPFGYAADDGTWEHERTTAADVRFDTDLPVTGVGFEEINCYLSWLQEVTGKEFKLPTVQQWQWFAYGEVRSTFPWGDEPGFDRANMRRGPGGERLFDFERVKQPYPRSAMAPVGMFEPNHFGVYDVIGNAAELIKDCRKAAWAVEFPVIECRVMGVYRPPLLFDPFSGYYLNMSSEANNTSTEAGFRIVEVGS